MVRNIHGDVLSRKKLRVRRILMPFLMCVSVATIFPQAALRIRVLMLWREICYPKMHAVKP